MQTRETNSTASTSITPQPQAKIENNFGKLYKNATCLGQELIKLCPASIKNIVTDQSYPKILQVFNSYSLWRNESLITVDSEEANAEPNNDKFSLDLLSALYKKIPSNDVAAFSSTCKDINNFFLETRTRAKMRGSMIEDLSVNCPSLKQIELVIPFENSQLQYLSKFSSLEKLILPARTNNENLKTIAHYLPNLKSLEINTFSITKEGLCEIEKFKELTSLKLIFNKSTLTTPGFLNLGKWEHLENLDLTNNHALTAENFVQIGQLKNLKNLKLSNTNVTDKDLLELSKLSKLESLDVSSFRPEITDNGLLNLGEMPRLKKLVLRNCNKITDQGLFYLTQQFKNLIDLNLRGIEGITDTGCVHLGKLENLEKLDLRGGSSYNGAASSHFHNEGLKNLKSLKKLEELYLFGNQNIDDEGLVHIKEFLNLKKLSLSQCQKITDDVFIAISELKNLEELDLSQCYSVKGTKLSHLESLKKLQHLNLSRTSIENANFVHLQKIENIKFLNLSFCSHINDEGLFQVAKIKKLETLNLGYCSNRFSSRDLSYLKNLNFLKNLNLYMTEVTESMMKNLGELKNLEDLNLDCCFFPYREYSASKKSFDYLCKSPKIKTLKLTSFNVTSGARLGHEEINSLKNLKNLANLFINDSIITDDENFEKFFQLPKIQKIYISEPFNKISEQKPKEYRSKIEIIESDW